VFLRVHETVGHLCLALPISAFFRRVQRNPGSRSFQSRQKREKFITYLFLGALETHETAADTLACICIMKLDYNVF
jgi:hypothetical protein